MRLRKTYAEAPQAAEPAPALHAPACPEAAAETERLAPGIFRPCSVQAFYAAQRLYGNRAVQRLAAGLPFVQRKCACGSTCAKCQDEEEQRKLSPVRRKAADAAGPTTDVVADVARHRAGG